MSRRAVVDGLVAKMQRLVELVSDCEAVVAITRHIEHKIDDFNVGEDELIESDPDAWLHLYCGLERVGWFEGQEDVWHSAIAKNNLVKPPCSFQAGASLCRRRATIRLWLRPCSIVPPARQLRLLMSQNRG
jgi:hypothetical protein